MSQEKPGMIASYKAGAKFQERYHPEKQLNLKKRVLATYQALLTKFAGSGLGQGARVLDTGSADGAFEKVCGLNSIDCTSLDIDHGVDFEKDPFPLPSGGFDLVNSNSVIEHLFDPSNYLREIHRVLKPGGYLILVTPHWPYASRTFYDSYSHVHPYSHKSLAECLVAYGFKPLALVPWLVMKDPRWWDIPRPWCFWVAKNLLFFPGTNKWAPGFLKGKSTTLLALAQAQPPDQPV